MPSKKLETRIHHLDRLFQRTLQGPYDAKRSWSAVRKLHRSGSRLVFDKAVRWSTSNNPRRRERAAGILCQISTGGPTRKRKTPKNPYTRLFTNEAFQGLARMLGHEHNEDALLSTIYGLGHLDNQQAVPLLAPFATSPSNRVRYAVAWSLGNFPNNTEAHQTLLKLCDDSDNDARNWALFAAGTQSEQDSPELRATLARHLDDPFPDAREEAIAGLAKRKDPRAIAPLHHLLKSGSHFAYHADDFEILLEQQAPESGWTTDSLLAALTTKFPDLT